MQSLAGEILLNIVSALQMSCFLAQLEYPCVDSPVFFGVIRSFYQVKLREMKPGQLSQELKEALGMPDGAPPPWLINMQVRGVALLACK